MVYKAAEHGEMDRKIEKCVHYKWNWLYHWIYNVQNWISDLKIMSECIAVEIVHTKKYKCHSILVNGQEIESYETPVLNDFVQLILNIIFINWLLLNGPFYNFTCVKVKRPNKYF